MKNSTESKILEILRNSEEKTPTQEIAKILNLERHTVSKYLEILQSKGLIQHQSIGRTKLWSLTESPVLSMIKEDNPFKEVLNAFDEGITIINKNEKIVWANNKVKNQHGSPCYEVYDTKQCKNCPAVHTFKTGKKHKAVNTFSKNGKQVSYEITTSPIKDDNKNTVAIMEVSKRIRG